MEQVKTLKVISETQKIESAVYVDPKGNKHEMLCFNTYTLQDPIKQLKKDLLAEKITEEEYFAKKDQLKGAKPELKINTFISKAFSKSKLQLILDNLDIVREFVGQ